MKYYYKLVTKECDDSYVSIATMGWVTVIYKKNKWTGPCLKKSKLFIFKSLEDAVRFQVRFAPCTTLFRCLAKNPTKATETISAFTMSDHVEDYWRRTKHAWRFLTVETPNGTYFCDKVKLVSRVEKHHINRIKRKIVGI